jgi:hypothetical protein
MKDCTVKASFGEMRLHPNHARFREVSIPAFVMTTIAAAEMKKNVTAMRKDMNVIVMRKVTNVHAENIMSIIMRSLIIMETR